MIDSELTQSISFKRVLRNHGVHVKKRIVQQLGVRVIENLELMRAKYGIKTSTEVLLKEKNEIYDELLKAGVKTMPGLMELIHRLRDNRFELALASSSNLSHIKVVLDQLKLTDSFVSVFSGDQVTRGKPNPEIYLKTAHKIKVEPGQCLVLEDTQTGVEAAKEAGMKCIAVPNEYTKELDFSRADLKMRSLVQVTIGDILAIMGDEYLDIVDEEDNWIGRDTRKKVHDGHFIHRGVHVFVLNDRGEILLQKRSEKKDYYLGFYDASVGAQVSATEDYKEAAIRETQEELGFKPTKFSMVCDYKSYSSRQRENRRLFTCNHSGPVDIDSDEVDFVKYYSVEMIKKEIARGEKSFTEGFKISFKKYINTL